MCVKLWEACVCVCVCFQLMWRPAGCVHTHIHATRCCSGQRAARASLTFTDRRSGTFWSTAFWPTCAETKCFQGQQGLYEQCSCTQARSEDVWVKTSISFSRERDPPPSALTPTSACGKKLESENCEGKSPLLLKLISISLYECHA